MQRERTEEVAQETEAPRFIQYLFFKVDPIWRRLSEEERERGCQQFAKVVEHARAVRTFSYSTLGLKTDADFMLWRTADTLNTLQETLAQLLNTGLGKYLQVAHSLWGMTRPSVYTRRRTTQEQAVDTRERLPYLTVYPFSKTIEWYLMSKEARQGMMNEHIRVGHEYAQVRQVLIYTTGLDDQEFIVAYETDDLYAYQGLLVALRSTEARRYTLKDQPVFTCVYRSLEDTLALL